MQTLLTQAVKAAGSYKPEDALPYIEEQLTGGEYETLHGFLSWVMEKGRTFGHNLPDVFADYEATLPKRKQKPAPFKFKPSKRVDGKASPSNAERAARAEAALTSYEGFEEDEPHLALQDFLSDVMHLCDRERWDFDDVLRMASGNWNAER
jgi:hypothetical protein